MPRLILLLLALLAPFAAIYWWSRRRLPRGEGPLTVFEIKRHRDAKAPRLEAALLLRLNVVEEARKAELLDPSLLVDKAVRTVARQEDLLKKIGEVLAATPTAAAQSELDTAEVDFEMALTTEERSKKSVRVKALTERLARLESLEQRQRALSEAADQLVFGIRSLHLAILDRSSAAVSEEALPPTEDPVAAARGALEALLQRPNPIEAPEIEAWMNGR